MIPALFTVLLFSVMLDYKTATKPPVERNKAINVIIQRRDIIYQHTAHAHDKKVLHTCKHTFYEYMYAQNLEY